MATNSQRQKGRAGIFSELNVAIGALNLAKEESSINPTKAVFGSVSALLTMISGSINDSQDYVEIGLNCADICTALDRGTNGKKQEDLSQSVREAINQLTAAVVEIQKNVTKQSKRNPVSRLLHAKGDKEAIAAWRQELNRILHVFNTELSINTNAAVSDIRDDVATTRDIVSDMHRTMVKREEEADSSTQTSIHGESPPPPPRVCFGREELIEKVIGLAENLEPIALIGAGGIGKTSIALTVLHHDRIKKRFGDNRRFIRCDQFPASCPHLLSRLSKAIGAGVENPEDLTPLRPFLSSKKMILFLDNAESILDPQGPDAREIYSVVVELSRFSNICLGITSRISTVPPHCKRPIISTLSMESACDIFYSIYEDGGRSETIDDLIRQLDFHALSVTLLATTAAHNMWDYDRLAEEWNIRRAQVLRTDYNESLAKTIELSLASPTFRKLGPEARDLLRVVAFFPQGVNEDNLDWLFPTIPDRRIIFDKFCVLSLTHRGNGFITMLAPLRDYLTPDPKLSPLLYATKDHYLTRLSVYINPGEPGFEEARWITSEDINVEHLLNIFTSIDTESDTIWDACSNFLAQLYWYKRRYTVLQPKIEGLPDDHRFKSYCLFELSRLSQSVGNFAEQKRLLNLCLKIVREQKDDLEVAFILRCLSGANSQLGLFAEGIQQVEEAVGVYEQHGDTVGQAQCWNALCDLLLQDNQFDAAEEAGSRAISLLPENGQEFLLCKHHQGLGEVYLSNGKREKAIHHLEASLTIASAFKWNGLQGRANYSLARLLLDEDKLEDASAHLEQAKTYIADNEYETNIMKEVQAEIWFRQGKLEDATSEALGALAIYEKLGSSQSAGNCKVFLRSIERAMAERGAPSGDL